jgi:phosphoribosylamine--glycine ligase
MMSAIDVLIVGGGGREHALAWKIARSPKLGRLCAAPGNPGIAGVAECVPLRVDDSDGIVSLASDRGIGLAVIGPEAPLAAGLADCLRAAGVPTFGPSAAAARIESSKAYARAVMTRRGVPQPEHAHFEDWASAAAYLDGLERRGVSSAVVKASGLAAGKGAVVCDSLDEARATARGMLEERAFGAAGREIVIEERLVGEEVSLFVVTDGREIVPLLPAQDYKRLRDGDEGPNTGGMGAYAPAPVLTPDLHREALETIVRPTLHGLAEDGAPFQGCLYAGLMKTADGLKVIEFNCRFGDPETQAVLPLMESDLLELLFAAARAELEGAEVRWRSGCAVSVVLAAGGYPGAVISGTPIHGLEEAAGLEGVTVFHAGTAEANGEVVTAGGRVLNVTGVGPTFVEAIDRTYAGVERIRFEGKQYRSDIARRVGDLAPRQSGNRSRISSSNA